MQYEDKMQYEDQRMKRASAAPRGREQYEDKRMKRAYGERAYEESMSSAAGGRSSAAGGRSSAAGGRSSLIHW